MDNLKKGALDIIILHTLQDQDRYGLEIINTINDRTSDAFQFKTGTLYPLLHRLEKAGLVTTRWQESDRGAPRKYYRLTKKGRRVLEKKRKEWEEFRNNIDLLLRPA